MIKGIGTDIAEVSRLERSLSRGNEFRDKVFSESEIAYCDKAGMPSYAGRFAAKEAFLKALGTGWRGNIQLNEIEVLNDELGKPYMNFLGQTAQELEPLNKQQIQVSISHTREYATAFVIIEE